MQLHAHVMHSVVATGRKGNPMSVTVCVESQPPKELCIYGVFDISGSMGQGSRSAFETMKQAVLDFVPALAKLRLPCQFGALAFNHEVKVLVPLTSLTSCDKVVELCNEALTEPGGNTDVGKALCAAFEQMHINLKRKRDAKDIHVFVLTDGQDPHLSQKLRHNERRLALFEMENTTVHMVSVGHDISKDLNSLVVKAAKRGTDNLINLPEQIPLVLDNFLDYMQHNVAANLLLRVRCGGEVVVAPMQLQLKVFFFFFLLCFCFAFVLLLFCFCFAFALLLFCFLLCFCTWAQAAMCTGRGAEDGAAAAACEGWKV